MFPPVLEFLQTSTYAETEEDDEVIELATAMVKSLQREEATRSLNFYELVSLIITSR